jgi:hypothetical protein
LHHFYAAQAPSPGISFDAGPALAPTLLNTRTKPPFFKTNTTFNNNLTHGLKQLYLPIYYDLNCYKRAWENKKKLVQFMTFLIVRLL